MKLGDRVIDGEFLERPNRYLAKVRINGRVVEAHVPDPGRLTGLMIPGRKARLVHNPSFTRKTQYTLVLIRHGSIWVSVYPVFANKLVEGGLVDGTIDCLGAFNSLRAETRRGKSRFDFEFGFSHGTGYIEVKSVSMVEKGIGKFPDAPTERGRKHVRELMELQRDGFRSVIIFVSQRVDAKSITSADDIDPEFGKYLREARAAGVEIYGYNCKVTSCSVSLNRQVKIIL